MCSIENCNLKNCENDDKCILHCEKKDSTLSDLTIEKFFKIFSNYLLKNKKNLNNGIIIDRVIFPDKKIYNLWSVFLEENIYFKECIFYGEITIKSVDLNSNLYFKNCTFVKGLKLENGLINGDLTFNNCLFKKRCSFYKTIFNGFLNLENSTFYKKLELKYGVFKNLVDFKNTTFENKVNIPCADFKSINDYLNININFSKNDRETARIIKDSFEQQNNIIEANKFYALEMYKYDEEITWKDNFKEKLILKLHDWSSEHSQNWLLPLFWILIFSCGYGLCQNVFLDESISIYYPLTSSFVGFFLVFLSFPFILDNIIENKRLKKYSLPFIFLIIGLYFLITNDLLLELPAKAINPFSVMKDSDNINGFQLIFKIIIAYLIYQLIISIRQNTRRK